MAKKWLIDAHNVIHKMPELKKKISIRSTDAVLEFCALIERTCQTHGNKSRIVFDGVPHIIPSKFKFIEVYFSRERTADEVIQQLLKKDGASDRWTVITDDREIRHHAYYYHTDILRVDVFLEKFVYKSPTPKPVVKAKLTEKIDPGSDVNPHIDDDEANELLNMFLRSNK